MSEFSQANACCYPEDCTDAISVHTRKITDSCRDKDCIEDLRVYLTTGSQALLDAATSAKVRCAELLYAQIEVEPVAFDHNHYCIDVNFYYRILADAVVGNARPATLYGLATFSKRAVLCGEESKAHIFTSETRICGTDGHANYSTNLPTAVVEVLDPMVLGSNVRDICECSCKESSHCHIPTHICQMFDEELVISGDRRRLFVTLGQFSIIRLERDAQVVVPIISYSLPTKECCDTAGCSPEDPCEMFSKIPFPVAQFSPKNCDHKGCSGTDTCNYTTT